MRERRWNNQYVDLARGKPKLLLSCDRNHMAPDENERLLCAIRNQNTIICDLGCGSGNHLIELATRSPSVFHIGVELRYKRVFRCAEKAERAGLENVFFVRCDIKSLLDNLPQGSVQGFYINFPDPWEKRRWEKHRFVSTQLVSRLHELLVTDGFVSCKTDHADYYAEIHQTLVHSGNFQIELSTTSRDLCLEIPENIPTEFELFFKNKGLSISYLRARKLTDRPRKGL